MCHRNYGITPGFGGIGLDFITTLLRWADVYKSPSGDKHYCLIGMCVHIQIYMHIHIHIHFKLTLEIKN